MELRFLVTEGLDAALDPSGEGTPTAYRRSRLQVRDGDAWVDVYEGAPVLLHDLLCRAPERYRLEVVDERRPLVLVHARWRWHDCEAGVETVGIAYEEGTFVVVRDDAGAIRWGEFRTRLVLGTRRLVHAADDGTETWSPVERIDERGELRVRRDGSLRYAWHGHPARAVTSDRELDLFDSRSRLTPSDALW